MYTIFDIEIVNAIPDNSPIEPGIQYCKGWTDYENMGISVMSICELGPGIYPDEEVLIFDWEDTDQRIDAISVLSLSNNVGGFNTKKFDDKLLKVNDVNITSHFDILEMVLIAAGQFGKAYWKQGLKYNLASIVEANGMEKTGNGALAPIWWQTGQRQKVRDYCKNDAQIEREVLRLLLNGELIDPNTNKKLSWTTPKN